MRPTRKYNGRYSHITDPVERKSRTNRNRQYKCRYGITLEDYEMMHEEQSGRCKICEETKRLVVEHNHENGKIRGLTCDRCNQLVGFLENASFDLIERASNYIYFDGNLNALERKKDESA